MANNLARAQKDAKSLKRKQGQQACSRTKCLLIGNGSGSSINNNRIECPELPNLSPYATELIPRTSYYHAQLARIGSPKANYNYGAVP
ncbi:hypothetical protein JHK86_016041 [Glycine max]|nr:hypothetical protein JHK86_016041 [Glycine max]